VNRCGVNVPVNVPVPAEFVNVPVTGVVARFAVATDRALSRTGAALAASAATTDRPMAMASDAAVAAIKR
jgi:hypothetical protein